MNRYQQLHEDLTFIESTINYAFKDKGLLTLAFVHRSFAHENPKMIVGDNERLEFLGDAILSAIISDFLYSYLPNHSEGELSYLRSCLVDAQSCSRYLRKMELQRFLIVGKGEGRNQGRGQEAILADLFEAIIGALYLDGGIEVVTPFFFDHFHPEVVAMIEKPHRNWKGELQEYCQRHGHGLPEYFLVEEKGADHRKTFYVQVLLDGKGFALGQGLSKKGGEQAAAKEAMVMIERRKSG